MMGTARGKEEEEEELVNKLCFGALPNVDIWLFLEVNIIEVV